MLTIQSLHIHINTKEVIKNLSLQIESSSIHALMGPNGSGKSSLAYTIVGHPSYAITQGTIIFKNNILNELSPDARARLGIFLTFQQPPALPGVKVLTFLKEAYTAVTGKPCSIKEFSALLTPYLDLLNIDPLFLHRNLHEGFSGGEKKKFEILQLLVLKPQLAILDEIDSGLDIDALKLVAQALQLARQENPNMSLLLITHYQRILHYIQPDYVHILCDGSIVTSGNAQLVHALEQQGYDGYRKSAQTI